MCIFEYIYIYIYNKINKHKNILLVRSIFHDFKKNQKVLKKKINIKEIGKKHQHYTVFFFFYFVWQNAS